MSASKWQQQQQVQLCILRAAHLQLNRCKPYVAEQVCGREGVPVTAGHLQLVGRLRALEPRHLLDVPGADAADGVLHALIVLVVLCSCGLAASRLSLMIALQSLCH